MAKDKLIKCSNCGHKISKLARTCPDCGHPVGIVGWITESKLVILISSLLGILGVNGLWFFDVFNREEQNAPAEIKVENPFKDYSGAMKKCPHCHGTGKTECPKCKGSGKPGYVICSNCKKEGTVKCRDCGGIGYSSRYNPTKGTHESISCQSCKSSGKVKCSICRGKGYNRCQHCVKGHVYCLKCGGTGKVPDR